MGNRHREHRHYPYFIQTPEEDIYNPTVTLNDLNWVTPETIRDTYAFFSADYEKDYEMYSRVYRNVAFFPAQKSLFIGNLTSAIKGIIKHD